MIGLITVPVSSPEGVQPDEIQPNFSLPQDPHITTGDAVFNAFDSSIPADGNDGSDTRNQFTSLEAFIDTPLRLALIPLFFSY